MSADNSFDEIMARLGLGDQAAAAAVFHRFARRLIGLASTRLEPRLRQKVDPEDIVQSVFRSFFLRNAGGAFDLGGWDDLWSLLVVITVRKCNRKARRFRGPERDVRREESPHAADGAGDFSERLACEPTPLEAVELNELVERFLGSLTERERSVAVLRLQGHSVPEIGQKLGLSEYTVKGILKKVRKRLESLYGDEGAVP